MNTAKKEAAQGFTQFELTTEVITKLNTFKLTPTAKLVLLYLTTCYNPKHKEVFPKQKTIALKLGVSERSVTRAVQELFKEGLILIECKYTNCYKFTSRIAEKCPVNLSDDSRQNDIKEKDNLSLTCIEQKKVTKKEQTLKSGENVYSGYGQSEDDRILYEYAKKKAKYDINAFIKAVKAKGGDKKIICEYKKKRFYTQTALRGYEDTQEQIKKYKQFQLTAESPESSTAWVNFGKSLGFKR